MGRQKLEQEKKLSTHFSIRLRAAEWQRIIAAAEVCGKAPRALVRERIVTGRFPAAKPSKLNLYTYTELKKIGVNLNQLTRKVNSGFLPPQLLGMLVKLEQRQETIIALLLDDSQPENR